MNWIDNAVCAGATDVFFPGPGYHTYDDAAALCAACPVLAECKADLFAAEGSVGDVFGYRAGLTPEERKELLRARGRRTAKTRDQARRALAYKAEGYSLNEIARILAVTQRTVSRLVGYAKEELAEIEERVAA